MAFQVVATLLALALGPIYVLLTEAGPVSKTVVVLLLVTGALLGWNAPSWSFRATAGTLIQCGVCIYILVYLRVQ